MERNDQSMVAGLSRGTVRIWYYKPHYLVPRWTKFRLHLAGWLMRMVDWVLPLGAGLAIGDEDDELDEDSELTTEEYDDVKAVPVSRFDRSIN